MSKPVAGCFTDPTTPLFSKFLLKAFFNNRSLVNGLNQTQGKRVLLCSSLAALFSLANGIGVPALARPIHSGDLRALENERVTAVFDFDDTILHLPHYDFLFRQDDPRPITEKQVFPISSEELAAFGPLIGRPGGPLSHLQLIGDDIDPINGSFRLARPGPHSGRNYFRDLMTPVTTDITGHPRPRVPEKHRAPFFDLYLKRSSSHSTWQETYINTARGHTQAEFQEGLWLLSTTKEAQTIRFRPTPPERIAQIGGTGPSALRKPQELIPVLASAIRRQQHSLFFLDDSESNVRAMARALLLRFRDQPMIDIRIVHVRKHEAHQVIALSDFYRARRLGSLIGVDEFIAIELPETPISAAEAYRLKNLFSNLACRASFF